MGISLMAQGRLKWNRDGLYLILMRFNFTEIGGFRQESQHNGWVKPSSQLREIIKTDDLFLAEFQIYPFCCASRLKRNL
ncbi:hypothetical protein HMPREF2572_01455 [Neisseria sp. HMSC064E01]|nr:hypothetical protein HMPREF2572_01455 [Neisseria sp. HMSC064E01]